MPLGDLLLDSEMESGEIFKLFFCPGCRRFHIFQLNENVKPAWTWNGDSKLPTFKPGLKVKRNDEVICHLEIKDGRIKYLPDSKHEFAGYTIRMERA